MTVPRRARLDPAEGPEPDAREPSQVPEPGAREERVARQDEGPHTPLVPEPDAREEPSLVPEPGAREERVARQDEGPTSNALTPAPERNHQGPDIWCEDLVRIYTTEGVEVQALQGLNLTVEPGEVVALIGASGSGKSTLLSILSGLDKPTGGRARVAGQDLTAMGARQRIDFRRHAVGFVFQQTSRNLLPFLTASENVAMPMIIAGRAERVERALQLLDLLGVADCADRTPSQMSGGQQQRVAIATALANAPAVLLADEPTGELDEVNSAEVLNIMRSAATELGTTVLIVTHDPMVSNHVTRTVQIRDGRTSTEVLRRITVGADGVEQEIAEEFSVLDRTGRLQLPAAHIETLGLHERVRITRETSHVGVWPVSEPDAPGRRTTHE